MGLVIHRVMWSAGVGAESAAESGESPTSLAFIDCFLGANSEEPSSDSEGCRRGGELGFPILDKRCLS